MSVHLNECQCYEGSCCPWMGDCTCQCICDVLRACEERVSGEFLTSAALAVTGMSDPRYAKGYTAALDAAREAVAPMEAVVLRIAATLVRHPSEDDLHDALQRHWCGELKAALFQYRAAIDALKESND